MGNGPVVKSSVNRPVPPEKDLSDAFAFLNKEAVTVEQTEVDVWVYFDPDGRAIGRLILDPFLNGPFRKDAWPALVEEVQNA